MFGFVNNMYVRTDHRYTAILFVLVSRPFPSHPPSFSNLLKMSPPLPFASSLPLSPDYRTMLTTESPHPLTMAHRVASRGGGSNGLAPLCVKDKRKAQAAAAAAAAVAATAAMAVTSTANARGNGNNNNDNNNNNERSIATNGPAASDVGNSPSPCCAASEEASSPPPPCRLAPVVIERSEIIRLASLYTRCAGCSAAVKGLLQRPIQDLRLVNAVVEEGVRAGEEEAGDSGRGRSKGGGGGGDRRHGGNGGGGGAAHGERACGHGCGRRASERVHPSCGQSSSSSTAGLPRPLCLREAYLSDRSRFDQVGDLSHRHFIAFYGTSCLL